jgi:hypothetical protein
VPEGDVVRAALRRALEDRHQLPRDLLQAGLEQALLGAEVRIQHRLGDAGGRGDVVHRALAVAALLEGAAGGREHERLALGAGDAGPAAGRPAALGLRRTGLHGCSVRAALAELARRSYPW